MRTILLTVLLSVTLVASALSQAGPGRSAPKKKKKAKADTTAVDSSRVDSTTAEKKPAPDTTRAPTPAPPARAEAKKPPKASPPPRREPPPNRPGFSRFVPRAVLCTGIVNREPVAPLDSVVTAVDTVYFFTAIADLGGTTVTHRWKHDGEVLAEIPMHIGGPHWRVYSRKVLLPEWAGDWVVEVVDEDTRMLVRHPFVYRPDSTGAR
jgi:hypothetical protein